jgi:hypothetical protein
VSSNSKFLLALFILGLTASALAQDAALSSAPEVQSPEPVTVAKLPLNILKDQAAIFTSPARLRTRDLRWLLPLAAATGVAIATDQRAMNTVVSRDPDFNQANVNASNVLIGGLIAAPAALFAIGHLRNDEHARETGLLGGEAMADGIIVEQIIKLVTWRERPQQDNSRGLFYQGGAHANSSFPSSHAVVAWSSAAALASEYRSPWAQVGLYTLATGVSLTRVLGQQHFPSDVLIGSATGWLIGHYVVRHRRHTPPR